MNRINLPVSLRHSPGLFLVALALLSGGCATTALIPPPLELRARPAVVNQGSEAEPGTATEAVHAAAPKVPETAPNRALKPNETAVPTAAETAGDEPANLSVNFEQLPLPTFIQVIFGEILKKTVNIDNAVMSRKELVTLRTGGPQTVSQVLSASRLLLKSYGLSVIEFGSMVRVVPDGAGMGALPEIRRGAALPDTPLPLRPIFQLVDLQAVRNTDVANWVKQMFGTKVTLQEDAGRNALLISGTPDNLRAALEAIAVLDQPVMRGRSALRFSPSFWGVDDLAKKLTEVLLAEGYTMPAPGATLTSGGIRYPIILLPVTNVNLLLVFTQTDTTGQHVLEWVRTLDQPNERSLGRNYFTYTAKNTSAEALAKTLNLLLSGGMLTAASPDGKAAAKPAAPSGGKVVVDAATNTLIFQSSSDEYPQFLSMLKVLDRPARQALIEVTVAEVTLGEDTQLGMEWQLLGANATSSWSAGTLGGLAIGSGGFTYQRILDGGDKRLILNALASDNKATILSSPRVMARNGEQASIQVGQEVPIITSQQTGVATGATAGILQTVQYRNTGVILRVKPVIHAGEQIDLDVAQEVSAAQSTNTGVNVSPTIATRKVETKLTLKHGSTVMLGGLISSDESDGQAGIPWLKDIPLIGFLFGKTTARKTKTEMIVLITPYIVNDDYDAQSITESFRDRLGEWAAPPRSMKDIAREAPIEKSPAPGAGVAQ